MVALFVLLTFAIFIVVDFFVLKAQGKKHPAFMTYKVFDKKSFLFPADVLFSEGHTWIKRLNNGLLKIGVDEFALKALSNLQLIPIKETGAEVKKGEAIFEGRFGSKSVMFKSPVTGTVSQINKNIENKKIANPYEDDWGVVITPSQPKELDYAKTAEAAAKWLQNEFARLKDFLSIHINDVMPAGATMHDGGNIVEGALSHLNEDAVKKFETEFLN